MRRRDASYARCIVSERTFLGEKAEYQVRVGDETLQVTRYSGAAPRFAAGSGVTLRLPDEGVGVLREGA